MGEGIWLFVHVAAMAFWLGGMFTVSIWTSRARRSGDRAVVAFAHTSARAIYRRIVSSAAVLSILSGGILVQVTGRSWFRPTPDHWLFQMQILGLIAFLATVFYVAPNAAALASLAERAAVGENDPDPEFAVRVKRQAVVGSVVGALLVYLVLLGAVRF